MFNISIQVFMPYLLIYYEKTLGMDNYVLIFAPAILLAVSNPSPKALLKVKSPL